MTFFDVLKDVITEKSGKLHEAPDFSKHFDKFMIIRWLSMDNRFVHIAEQLNRNCYHRLLNDEEFYKLLINLVPRYNNHYIKYIKKESKDTTTKST